MLSEQRISDPGSAAAVFDRHVRAFVSGDLEAVLEDFDERSVIVTPQGVFVGLDGARQVLGGLLEEFGCIGRGDSPGFTFEAQVAHGDTLLVTWRAESKQRVFPFGTDTFFCVGDKVRRQTIAFSTPLPQSR